MEAESRLHRLRDRDVGGMRSVFHDELGDKMGMWADGGLAVSGRDWVIDLDTTSRRKQDAARLRAQHLRHHTIRIEKLKLAQDGGKFADAPAIGRVGRQIRQQIEAYFVHGMARHGSTKARSSWEP